MQVPFAEWLPDLPDHMNPGATEATNVFPAVNSYRPFNDIAVTSSNALTARCQGARAFKSLFSTAIRINVATLISSCCS